MIMMEGKGALFTLVTESGGIRLATFLGLASALRDWDKERIYSEERC